MAFETTAGCIGDTIPSGTVEGTWPISPGNNETITFTPLNEAFLNTFQSLNCEQSVSQNIGTLGQVSFSKINSLGTDNNLFQVKVTTLEINECVTYYVAKIVGGKCASNNAFSSEQAKLDCINDHPSVPDSIVKDAKAARVIRSGTFIDYELNQLVLTYSNVTTADQIFPQQSLSVG